MLSWVYGRKLVTVKLVTVFVLAVGVSWCKMTAENICNNYKMLCNALTNCNLSFYYSSCKDTHTGLTALFLDYTGELVPER